MSIHIIEGLPRHGKSTYATLKILRWQAYYAKKKREPRQIVSNFEIHLPGVICTDDWEEMMRVMQQKPSIVVIDEAAQWFSAHQSARNSRFMGSFRQHGKDGHTLFLIAHSFADLDVSIRDRTAETITRIKRLFGPTQWEEPSIIEDTFGWWAIAYRYQARDYETVTKRRRLGVELFRIDSLHGYFDTLVKIGHMGDGSSRGNGLASGGLVTAPRVRQAVAKRSEPPTPEPRWRREPGPWPGLASYGQTVDDLMDQLREGPGCETV